MKESSFRPERARGMAKAPASAVLDYVHLMLENRPADATPDGPLLERYVQNGDEEAFESLVARHAQLVWGLCRRLLPGEADAEDVFQATFLVLARRAATVRRSASLGSW